jgi:hypothetical protein
MKAFLINLFEPADFKPPPKLKVPTDFDFIEHYYDKADFTHVWNTSGSAQS